MLGVLPNVVLLSWGVIVAALFSYSLAPGGAGAGKALPFVNQEPWTRSERSILFSLLLLGFFLRTYNLTSYPIEIHNDEASVGMYAKRWLLDSESFPYLFGSAWAGLPELSYITSGLSMMIFGDTLWGLRIGSAVLGTLSLLGAYLLFRLLFGKVTAIIALSLLVPFHWHLHISRTGHHYIQAALASPWGLYLFLKGLGERKTKVVILAAIFTGFLSHMYFAARVVPIIQGAIFLFLVLADLKEWKKLFGHYLLFVAVLFVFLSPSLYYFANNFSEFELRTRAVSLFNEESANHIKGYVGSSSWIDIFLYQLKNSFGIFLFRGDSSVQYGRVSPFISEALYIPFIAGLLMAIRGLIYLRWFAMLASLFLTLFLGGVLTIDPPFSPRLSTLPGLILIYPAAFFALVLLQFRGLFVKILVSFSIFLIGAYDLYWYKTEYIGNRLGSRRDQIVRIIDDNRNITTVVNLFPDEEEWGYESYQFLAPKVTFIDGYGYPVGSLKKALLSAQSALVISPDPIPSLGITIKSGVLETPNRFYYSIIAPIR